MEPNKILQQFEGRVNVLVDNGYAALMKEFNELCGQIINISAENLKLSMKKEVLEINRCLLKERVNSHPNQEQLLYKTDDQKYKGDSLEELTISKKKICIVSDANSVKPQKKTTKTLTYNDSVNEYDDTVEDNLEMSLRERTQPLTNMQQNECYPNNEYSLTVPDPLFATYTENPSIFQQPNISSEQLNTSISYIPKLPYNNSKEFQCEECKFSSAFKSSLKMHVKRIHDNVRDVNCTSCNYAATRKAEIDLHVKAVHTMIRDHRCYECSYTSSTKSNLVKHQSSKHMLLEQ